MFEARPDLQRCPFLVFWTGGCVSIGHWRSGFRVRGLLDSVGLPFELRAAAKAAADAGAGRPRVAGSQVVVIRHRHLLPVLYGLSIYSPLPADLVRCIPG